MQNRFIGQPCGWVDKGFDTPVKKKGKQVQTPSKSETKQESDEDDKVFRFDAAGRLYEDISHKPQMNVEGSRQKRDQSSRSSSMPASVGPKKIATSKVMSKNAPENKQVYLAPKK